MAEQRQNNGKPLTFIDYINFVSVIVIHTQNYASIKVPTQIH